MAIEISKLEEGLQNLRGLDFELAEQRTRMKHPTAMEVSLLKEFQARLAAMALGVPYEDIAELPLKKYAQVCQVTFNFLFAPSGDETPAES